MKPYIKLFHSGLRMFFLKTSKTSQVRINIAVNVGSKDEDDNNNGISHFIEHMMFSGTKTRNAQRINIDFENIGAETNAFTTKTFTCYYSSCLMEKAEECFSILSDMVFNTTFDEKKLNKERKVIYSEIDKDKDNHAKELNAQVSRIFFDATPYSNNVIGTKSTLKNINRDKILSYYKKHYIAPNFIISLVGPFTKRQAIKLVQKYIDVHFQNERNKPSKLLRGEINVVGRKSICIKKDVNQDKIQLSFPIEGIYSSKIGAYDLFSCILGGGASSRLFSKIREEMALVYSIFASTSFSSYGGMLSIHLGTSEQNTIKALKEIRKIIENLKQNGVTQEELDRAKIVLKTDFLSSMESNSYVAGEAVISLLQMGRYVSAEQRLKEWQNVTKSDIEEVIKEIDFNKVVAGIVSKNNSKSVFKIFDK